MNGETGVAIIGMAGRFPGADTVEQLWSNLCDGVESVSFFEPHELHPSIDPALSGHPNYVRARGIVDAYDRFDADFFNISPRQAELWDPQHRLFLETAWTALEHAGYHPRGFDGAIGVFAGKSESTYRLNNIESNPEKKKGLDPLQIIVANDKDYLPTTVSFYLDLKGPSVNVQTACSTSLVAVAYAFDSLMTYQCDMALAGGISLACPQESGYLWNEGTIASRDGRCRPFDAAAEGTVFSNGVGIVVLKRLEDALGDGDEIYAVLRGVALNNDGGTGKMSFMAPSVAGQAAVIAMAQAAADVDPAAISYIEAHGTATQLGDPVEIEALTQAFRIKTQERGFCAIGSIKGNIGHLDTAAGVAGLIKTALALKNKRIPPSLHFKKPNLNIDFSATPFYVNDRPAEWSPVGATRLAGVSSFGIGGTNAHVILEEAPEVPADEAPGTGGRHLLVVSARTATALETATGNLAAFLRRHSEVNLADAAYTLQVGRKAFKHRRALVCEHAGAAAEGLAARDGALTVSGAAWSEAGQVVFMFTGQGAQHPFMGAQLYAHEPVFRDHVDRCSELLQPVLGLDLRQVLYPTDGDRQAAAQRLDQTAISQPALFVIESALGHLWMDLGVEPAAMIGHSIGEYVAAYFAGVFTLDVALDLVAARGRLMQAQAPGAMVAVTLSEEDAAAYLGAGVELAAVNAPAQCVLSGPPEAIAALKACWAASGSAVRCVDLRTSHAFHSATMASALAPFAQLVAAAGPKAPRIPFISNVTGTWISAQQAVDAQYWAAHLRRPVRFSQGLATLLETPGRLFLELGPGNTLCALAGMHQGPGAVMETVASLPHPRQTVCDHAHFLGALGRYWVTGGDIRWQRLHHQARRRRIALPTYPFEGKRYWIEPQGVGDGLARQAAAAPCDDCFPEVPAPLTAVGHQGLIIALWQQLLGLDEIQATDNFFELGGDSLLAAQVITRLRAHCAGEIALRAIFDHPTVEALAGYLQAHAGAVARPTPVMVSAGERALTEAERRLWYGHCFDPMSTAKHLVQAVKVSGPLRQKWLQASLDALAARHAPLGTTFDACGGVPYAAAGRVLQIPLQATACADQAQLRHWIEQQARQPFDWAAGPLARGALARMGPDAHVWALIVHRIIAEPAALTAWVAEVFEMYPVLASDGSARHPGGKAPVSEALNWEYLSLDQSNLLKS